MKRTVTNIDKKGNIIEDLSKVIIPIDIQKDIFEILNPGLTAVFTDETEGDKAVDQEKTVEDVLQKRKK